jgi:hypothetical protein
LPAAAVAADAPVHVRAVEAHPDLVAAGARLDQIERDVGVGPGVQLDPVAGRDVLDPLLGEERLSAAAVVAVGAPATRAAGRFGRAGTIAGTRVRAAVRGTVAGGFEPVGTAAKSLRGRHPARPGARTTRASRGRCDRSPDAADRSKRSFFPRK